MDDNVANLTSLHVNLSQTLIVVVTICAAAVFGLVVLHRATRANITWGIAFGLGLLGTYVWVAANEMELPALRALASGMMLAVEPLIWLGVRLFAGRKVVWAPPILFAVLAPAVLTLTVETPAFSSFFRICFGAAGVFAALIAWDLVRLRAVSHDIVLPLQLASVAFVVVAILNTIWPVVSPLLDGAAQVAVMRDVNGIGTLVTTLSATLTIVLLVRSRGRQSGRSQTDADASIRARVERVRSHQETAWSLLDVRLDHTSDLSEATSAAGFAAILSRFRLHVFGALPPSADIVQMGESRFLALLPGSDEAVEHHLRNVLDRVSTVDDGGDSGAIRTSASVGWATMLDGRFKYEQLAALASQRAERAGELGGDRWERLPSDTRNVPIVTV